MSTANPVLHHVNLKTTRLQEMIDWYALTLGMRVNHQFPGGAFLTNDDANHRIAIVSTPNLVDDPDTLRHTGLHHTAWEYATLNELLEIYVYMRDKGQLPHRTVNHGPITSFYYEDPDGNSVELQNDNFGDWSKSAEWMRTSADFAANPIGTFFDPVLVYDKMKSGVDFKVLQKSIRAGDYLPNPVPAHIGLPTP